MDGTGHLSFTGLFSRGAALGLAVFESSFYWVDDRGLWQVPQTQPNQKTFLLKGALPTLAVYHEFQQPLGTYGNKIFNSNAIYLLIGVFLSLNWL